jgi:hypothetical protein
MQHAVFEPYALNTLSLIVLNASQEIVLLLICFLPQAQTGVPGNFSDCAKLCEAMGTWSGARIIK